MEEKAQVASVHHMEKSGKQTRKNVQRVRGTNVKKIAERESLGERKIKGQTRPETEKEKIGPLVEIKQKRRKYGDIYQTVACRFEGQGFGGGRYSGHSKSTETLVEFR